MNDYISRDAAIKLFNFAVLDCLGMEPTIRAGDIVKALESIPAADVRPVVCCWDCKHFQINVSLNGYLPQNVPECECRNWCRATDPTDFCSYGEKMEET